MDEVFVWIDQASKALDAWISKNVVLLTGVVVFLMILIVAWIIYDGIHPRGTW